MENLKELSNEELAFQLKTVGAEFNALSQESARRTDAQTTLNYNKYAKLQKLEEISRNNPDGFTVHKDTLEPIASGFAVAVSETQGSVGMYGLTQVIEHAEEKSYIDAIGGWLGDDYFYDAVMVVDNLELAAELGYKNKQKAIYDITKGETIWLKY